MTRKKSTKRALLLSVMSMIMCVAMLMSTTYAWFTDSVSSANNIIKAGNLDVTLEYWDGTEWKDVEGASEILAFNRCEPGYTEVAYLRLKNAGSLALKYSMGVNITSEDTGVNVAGKEFKLSDYIYYDVVEGQQPTFADREAAMVHATETTKISAGYSKMGTLTAGSDYVFLAMIVYMPTTVGNEAVHNREDIPVINLGINVIAAQFTYESDSFDENYDGKSGGADFVADVESVREALTEGGKVSLFDDVTMTDDDEIINAFPGYARPYPAAVQVTKDTDLYLNGKDFTYTGTGDVYYLIQVTNGAVLNIYGDESSVLSSSCLNGTNAVAANRGAVVNIYGGTYASKEPSIVDLNRATVNIYDGFFYVENYRGNGVHTDSLLNYTNGSASTINCYGGTYVNFDPRAAQDGNFVPAGYTVVTETQVNGEIWYTVVPE